MEKMPLDYEEREDRDYWMDILDYSDREDEE